MAAFFCLGFGLHAAAAVSDFESGIDGWIGYSCPNPGDCTAIGSGNLAIDLVLSGGSPPGGGAPEGDNQFIETLDPGGSLAARVEPNPGKFASLYAPGAVLSFDARVNSGNGGGGYDLDDFGAAPLVAIETSGGVLVYLTAELPEIDRDWKHYRVPLVNDPAAWIFAVVDGAGNVSSASPVSDVQFAAALGAMTRLTLISEWLKEGGEVDTGGIDNFQVVPIPAALPLLGSALLLLGARRRTAAS
ncbi:MAG: hypothetical protein ACU85V_01040 [Gammaproteobacteria bacterium]